MKNTSLFLLLLLAFPAFGQVSVTVNTATTLRHLNGTENGINLNYLMDDSYLGPSTLSQTASALKKMGAKLLRYPGGEKSDNYLWSAAPWTAASPRMALKDPAYFWPTGDPSFIDTASAEKLCKEVVLDFDEFMELCTAAEASPLIVVAYDGLYNATPGLGKPTKAELITNAVEWVRYANITKGYGIRYWMIGNESWNDPGYNGRATPAQYAADLVEFASAMKAVDPNIKIVANGRSDWWQTLLQSPAVAYIDILGFSNYPVWNYYGGYEYYRSNNVNLAAEAESAISQIRTYAPAAHRNRLKVLPAEYNSLDWSGNWTKENDLGHALCNFQMFGDLVVKPEVESLCMWNTRWMDNGTKGQEIYDAIDRNSGLNATGVGMSLWGSGLLQSMVGAVSNHSMVKVYASHDPLENRLHIFLLNKDHTAKGVALTLQGYGLNFTGSKWLFSGSGVLDKFPAYSRIDTVANAESIQSLTLPPNSVTVLRLQQPNIVLPLQLHSFKGVPLPGATELSWTATLPPRFSHFEIQKGTQPDQFVPVGIVKPQTLQQQKFVFSEPLPPTEQPVYYRLKMVDADKSFRYSGIVAVKRDKKQPELTLQVRPNPVRGDLVFQIQAPKEGQAAYRITDASGKLLLTGHAGMQEGQNTVRIPAVRLLPSGMFHLYLRVQEWEGVTTFLK